MSLKSIVITSCARALCAAVSAALPTSAPPSTILRLPVSTPSPGAADTSPPLAPPNERRPWRAKRRLVVGIAALRIVVVVATRALGRLGAPRRRARCRAS
jgi:hypothetical protein